MDWYNIVISVLGGGLVIVLIIGLGHRLLRDYLKKEKSCEARLIDKYDNTYFDPLKYGTATTSSNLILVFFTIGNG